MQHQTHQPIKTILFTQLILGTNPLVLTNHESDKMFTHLSEVGEIGFPNYNFLHTK